jgi:hypothetical protein
MIWQRFWRAILASDESTQLAYERLMTLDDTVRRVGFHAYESGLFPPNSEIAQMRRVARELEGIDVYYKGEVSDPTYWGRMYIKPFPFVCVIVYDVSEKTVEIHDHNIEEFVRQNLMEPEIAAARQTRRALRCLDGEMIHWECEASTLPISGAVCGLVPRTCLCHYGYLRVMTKSNDPFCHGFEVVIDFSDGVWVDAAGKEHPNQHCRLTNKDLGISRDFGSNVLMTDILRDPRNKFLVESKWDDLNERLKLFRNDLEQERLEGEAELSPAFWTFVYNNQHLPRDQLDDFLHTIEQNPAVQTILTTKKADFDSLYSRLKYFDSHPAISLWYAFWDDVYTNNMYMKALQQNAEFFDLTSRWAIAYNPVPMEKLKDNLRIIGLRTKRGGGLFGDKILDKLEAKLVEIGGTQQIMKKPAFVIPVSAEAIKDPRSTTSVILPANATYLAEAALLTLE